MTTPRDHVETRLRVPTDALALIDATVAKAREEFDDPEIDRQRVLEHRLVTEGSEESCAFGKTVKI